MSVRAQRRRVRPPDPAVVAERMLARAKGLAECQRCGAPLVWGATGNGSPIRLDREPNPDGNVALVDGVARLGREARDADGRWERYTVHSCPAGER